MKKGIAIILIVVLAVGIYYSLAFQQLTYGIETASIDAVGLLSASMTITLRITNPNALPLYFAATDFDLYINGTYTGHGSTSATTLLGMEYQTIQTPITISYTGLTVSLVRIMLGGGAVALDIQGNASLFFIPVPFHISDTVTVR